VAIIIIISAAAAKASRRRPGGRLAISAVAAMAAAAALGGLFAYINAASITPRRKRLLLRTGRTAAYRLAGGVATYHMLRQLAALARRRGY